jgi:hypothetical protein
MILVTLGFLNKNCKIDCIIVKNNASNDLNIDKVYKLSLFTQKNAHELSCLMQDFEMVY